MRGTETINRAWIDAVTMGMWSVYIASTKAHTDAVMVYDKFHITRYLCRAVDEVRRAEQRRLLTAGDKRLTGTRYVWLRNVGEMSGVGRREFAVLRGSNLKVTRAWALKESARALWCYKSRGWAVRSRLPAMVEVARMLKRHWDGVINAATTDATNAMAENITKIQRIKRMDCGYRNRIRFHNDIYFHLGGLNLYPETIRHTSG